MTRVMITDDHILVREGIRELLKHESDIEVVCEAGDGRETIKQLKTVRPDILIIDIAMPGINGLDTIALSRETAPGIKIIVLSMYANEPYIRQALANGALGYVLKTSSSSELLTAIRCVSSGEYYLSSQIKAAVIGEYLKGESRRNPAADKYNLLSEREKQVLRLTVAGNSVQEIADILNISPKTAAKHRSNLMAKLNIHDLISLVKYAIRIGLLDTEEIIAG